MTDMQVELDKIDPEFLRLEMAVFDQMPRVLKDAIRDTGISIEQGLYIWESFDEVGDPDPATAAANHIRKAATKAHWEKMRKVRI
jgi:hypothetical protein